MVADAFKGGEWPRVVLRGVLLAGFVASSWWLLNLARGPEEETVGRSPHAPDAYLTNFELVEMDAQGAVRQRIFGQRMDHYADTRVSEVAHPRVELVSGDGGPTWNIDAASGVMPDHGDVVTLVGPVTARTRNGGNVETVIDTADVEIDTQANTARSAAPVKITGSMGVTEGVGLRADMQQRRYQLLGSVRGWYDRKSEGAVGDGTPGK